MSGPSRALGVRSSKAKQLALRPLRGRDQPQPCRVGRAESVAEEDVAVALDVLGRFLELLAAERYLPATEET